MKICIATGSRAEYGLLKPLIDEISAVDGWRLQVLVTGAHLSPEFGLTYKKIEEDGVAIDAKVEMLLSSDSAEGVVKSMGLGLIGYADAFKRLMPDLLIVLGDRYEMLAVVSAALIYKIPVAHLHGGEITEGAFDDAIRHAITKMSHLHFASTNVYKKRIIQMGEMPEHVFNVGAIGLDNIINLKLLSKEALAADLGINIKSKLFLITYHPVTLQNQSSAEYFETLLQVVNDYSDVTLIFTKANSDTDGRVINTMIDQYVSLHKDKALGFTSMGQLRYLSAMKYADAVIGNSSSGIIEAPAFNVPTVNIGDRQKGRLRSPSVIDCGERKEDIKEAIDKALSDNFKQVISRQINPYGDGTTAKQIVQILSRMEYKDLIQKSFTDII